MHKSSQPPPLATACSGLHLCPATLVSALLAPLSTSGYLCHSLLAPKMPPPSLLSPYCLDGKKTGSGQGHLEGSRPC